jgi:hypothetical protein
MEIGFHAQHNIRRWESVIYDIKATHNDQSVRRVAYGDMQAWLIINQLSRDGCKNICMSERGTSGGVKDGKI